MFTNVGSTTTVSVDADGGADSFVQIATIYGGNYQGDEIAFETSGNLITV